MDIILLFLIINLLYDSKYEHFIVYLGSHYIGGLYIYYLSFIGSFNKSPRLLDVNKTNSA